MTSWELAVVVGIAIHIICLIVIIDGMIDQL